MEGIDTELEPVRSTRPIQLKRVRRTSRAAKAGRLVSGLLIYRPNSVVTPKVGFPCGRGLGETGSVPWDVSIPGRIIR